MTKSSEIPEGYNETEFGILPVEWQIKKIGELFNVQQGISMSQVRRDGPNKHPFLRTLNVFWTGIDLKTLDYMDFSDKEIEKLNLLPGDLLVCEGGDIGRTAMWQGELESCGYQNHLHRLRVKNNDVNPEFVAFWMQAAMKVLGFYHDEGNKTTIPNLSQSRLKNFDIPLPPLPEQHAIATTLRTVQVAKEKTDDVIAATKALKAAMMKHLFTKDAERFFNLDEWTDCCLGDIINLKRGYDLPNSERVFGEYPVISSSGIFSYHKEPKVKGPGVVTGRYGTLGEVFYVEGDYWPLNTTLYVQDFKENHPRYISYLLQSMSLGEHNFASSVPGVNRNILHQLPVKIPPKTIQEKIADIIYVIDQNLAAEQSHKEALDTLFTSILHDLMTAKIRVNPAEVA